MLSSRLRTILTLTSRGSSVILQSLSKAYLKVRHNCIIMRIAKKKQLSMGNQDDFVKIGAVVANG